MSNKRWEQNGEAYELHFTPFCEDEVIATLYYDEGWCCKSDMVSLDWLDSDALEEAKQEVEDAVENHFTDQIEYYSHLLKTFKEVEHGTRL